MENAHRLWYKRTSVYTLQGFKGWEYTSAQVWETFRPHIAGSKPNQNHLVRAHNKRETSKQRSCLVYQYQGKSSNTADDNPWLYMSASIQSWMHFSTYRSKGESAGGRKSNPKGEMVSQWCLNGEPDNQLVGKQWMQLSEIKTIWRRQSYSGVCYRHQLSAEWEGKLAGIRVNGIHRNR